MSSDKSLKSVKKRSKQQVKSLEKAINKAVKKRLKLINFDHAPIKKIDQIDIDNLAKDIAKQLLPKNNDANKISSKKKVSQLTAKPSQMGFALTPFKKSPCKQCPAKSGGLCACAIKANKKSKTG